MSNKILFALLMLTSACAFAQDVSLIPSNAPKNYTKEIGVFGQLNIGSSNIDDNISFGGVQYKKWINNYQGFRVIAGYGNYSKYQGLSSNRNQLSSEDTIVQKYTESSINLGIIGFGIEAKRTFYKRIVLFAAIEVRGGYGSGKQKDYTETSISNQTQNYYGRVLTDSRDANLLYIAATPSIGAKFQFKRLNFGIEGTAINFNITNLTTHQNGLKKANGIANFDLGSNISNRVFLSYAF